MTRRRTAILVTVAVVAGAAVAGVGLATRSSGKPARVLQIDERNGRVGRVVLGETRANVLSVLGPPLYSTSLGVSPRRILGYPQLRITFSPNGGVISIETDDPAARTDEAVRIGDPLSAARASYRKDAHCVPNSPDKTAPHPRCSIKAGSGTMLITGDPIRSITLVAPAR
jgi:hypothetical protein